MKTIGTITIALKGKKLGREQVKVRDWGRNKYETRETDTATAEMITDRLAIYKLPDEKEEWYHVIHIPTGFVIAYVHYTDVGMVKKTFEKIRWTLKNGNELHALGLGFSFFMTCNLCYDIKEVHHAES